MLEAYTKWTPISCHAYKRDPVSPLISPLVLFSDNSLNHSLHAGVISLRRKRAAVFRGTASVLRCHFTYLDRFLILMSFNPRFLCCLSIYIQLHSALGLLNRLFWDVCSRKITHTCQVNGFGFVRAFICCSPIWEGYVSQNTYLQKRYLKNLHCVNTFFLFLHCFAFANFDDTHHWTTYGNRKYFVSILNYGNKFL